jgi:riboflavin kinase/FMN adenylyltransferase
LGFRTANLQVDAQRALPQRGVYAAWANLTDGRQKSVVNVGTRPTFDEQDLLIEAHLLNYAGDLYGEQICIEFVQRLRSERQFADAGALTAQIQRDIAVAQEILVEREKKTPQV